CGARGCGGGAERASAVVERAGRVRWWNGPGGCGGGAERAGAVVVRSGQVGCPAVRGGLPVPA
ncbi:hypothetical protein, partial [Streptomyces sp. NRRL F-5650]|uniref:hypothetical protein n=1 Tax=Streptomyces sp. NRRL F-5650 TaxID=1463868 RepID=UPI001F18F9AD